MSSTTLLNPRGIATVSLPGTLTQKLHACAAAGFTHIELFEDDVLRYPHPLSHLRQLCQSLGLTICMYQPFRDLAEWTDRSQFETALERLGSKFRWMDELETDLILVVSNCQPKEAVTNDFDEVVSQYREAAEFAASHGKRIVFEALAWGTNISLWGQSWDVVRAVDHPAFGLCLDSFHIYCRHDSITGLADIPAEKIFIVQMADAPYLDMAVLEWSRHFRSFPGQGEMPMLPFVHELRKTGYSGILSLEVFSDSIRNGDVTELARDAMRSLQFLDEPPTAKPPTALEFIEFALSPTELPSTTAFLQSLGFNPAGSHRSKAVHWLTSGSVSIVLNAETPSHAARHYAEHGLSVCAIAVRVPNAFTTVSRAAELGYRIIHSPKLGLAASEANIEAIAAPGGMLVYIVDSSSFWGQDFVPTSVPTASTSKTAAYKSVDALTTILPVLSAVENSTLFWRCVFGLASARSPDVQDPLGLVSAWTTVPVTEMARITLNVPHTKHSVAGRLGSGVSVIAVSTADIFSTLATLPKSETLCNLGEKYYDDLRYRYALSPEFVEQMRQGNVIYERDTKGGELLSIFTKQMGGRGAYWQVVERRGGYSGLGNGVNGLALQCAVLHQVRDSTAVTEIKNKILSKDMSAEQKKVEKVGRKGFGRLWQRASVVFTSTL